MATLGGSVLTLAEIAKREDPNGMPAKIAETLHQSNMMLSDMPMVESNLPTAHRSTIRVGLPTVYTRRLNAGVPSSRSTTAQITDGISLLEAHSFVDSKLLEISGNPAEMRRQEAVPFVEAMAQKQQYLAIYGDESSDETEYNGFSVRYDSSTVGNEADNVLTAGGSGADQSSIWLIGWGLDKIFGVYPRGTVGGLRHKDLGEEMVQVDSTGSAALGLSSNQMLAHRDMWTWDCGLVVKDWRYAVRIANIEVAEANALSGTQTITTYATNIQYLMADAMHRIPSLDACRPCFYMNRTMFSAFDRMLIAQSNSNIYRTQDANGNMVMTFRGIPIKKIDQLTYTESAI